MIRVNNLNVLNINIISFLDMAKNIDYQKLKANKTKINHNLRKNLNCMHIKFKMYLAHYIFQHISRKNQEDYHIS